jgi:hypothetical protein
MFIIITINKNNKNNKISAFRPGEDQVAVLLLQSPKMNNSLTM